jgi:ribonucleoside-diphosphate reductase alpha chain
VDQFTFTRFEPQGPVEGHPYVKFSTSIVDFVFRALGVDYLKRYDLAHIKPGIEDSVPVTPEPPSRRQLPDGEPLPHTREATARSAAMDETLGRRPEGFGPSENVGREKENSGDGIVGSPLDAQLDTMMGDAPVCDVCGHITVRNGACYKCLNCGNSMGCS